MLRSRLGVRRIRGEVALVVLVLVLPFLLLSLSLLLLPSASTSTSTAPPRGRDRAKRLALVLGMHHSMTSVATRLLAAHPDFFLGDPSQLLMRRDNAFKYWELRAAVQANQQLLDATRDVSNARARASYDWLGYGCDVNRSAAVHTQRLMGRARETIRELVDHAAPGRVAVIKDPRMSLAAGVWLDAARAEQALVVCVLLVRDPIESVFRFLADYNNAETALSAAEWGSAWEQYTTRAALDCASRHAEIVVVRHEDYGKDPHATNAALIARVLRAFDMDETEPSATVDMPDLWREKHAKKAEWWAHAKTNLPLSYGDLVSPQGMAIYRTLSDHRATIPTQPANGKDDVAEAILGLGGGPPQWKPLEVRSDFVVATILLRESDYLHQNLLVLYRSLVAFDASRTRVAVLAYSRNKHHADPTEHSLQAMGWVTRRHASPLAHSHNGNAHISKLVEDQVKQALRDEFLVPEAHLVPPHAFVTGPSLDVFASCPHGKCAPPATAREQHMYQALADLGGRVSEA